MDSSARIGLAFVMWLVVVVLVSLAIGPERKRKWFYLRDQSRSFLNRRGMLGELMQFGVPRTREGWGVIAGFLAMILLTSHFALDS